jgi:ketosteroid isomerase-like protein
VPLEARDFPIDRLARNLEIAAEVVLDQIAVEAGDLLAGVCAARRAGVQVSPLLAGNISPPVWVPTYASRCASSIEVRRGGTDTVPPHIVSRRAIASHPCVPELHSRVARHAAAKRPAGQKDRQYAGAMNHKVRVQEVMEAMSQGRIGPPFDLMADAVTWRWMGVSQWSRTFEGKQLVVDKLFGGAAEALSHAFSVEVRHIHADGDCVVVEHSGRNKLPDGRRYDNNYCWVFRFEEGLIQEVREYMDTQLVTGTFGADTGA